ncbi:MAG: hypothetical protein IPH21_13620 [Flavobacteriales bacterium]|nr:hypothetical protein [Flavobacteriales bacterium]
MDISDKQWEVLEKPLTSIFHKSETRAGPEWVLRILWICRTGATWASDTRHTRLAIGTTNTGARAVLGINCCMLLHRISMREDDITECFIDGTFASAKRGLVLDLLRKGKAPRSAVTALLVFLSPYGPLAPAPRVKLADRTVVRVP